MLTRLHLTDFKNFADATLELGPFTVLVGTNASGKSNVRDALRFLHGIGRGYSFAEIIGRKYLDSGELQWSGIRGGLSEITRNGSTSFVVEAGVEFQNTQVGAVKCRGVYLVELERHWKSMLCKRECVQFDEQKVLFESKLMDLTHLSFNQVQVGVNRYLDLTISNDMPVLVRLADSSAFNIKEDEKATLTNIVQGFKSIRFLDPDPEAMRRPAVPGAIHLGDRGENLSAVLMDICRDPAQKQTLMAWLAELTPMDVVDFEFPSDLTGAVLAVLVERSGCKVSAYSASDGTLRFLAILAALLGRERGRCYFIEELDNGLHPARLHLLVELIERQTAAGHVQVIASTHSPQLLELLSPASREHASLIYRLPDSDDARIVRIQDLPNAREVLQRESLAELHAAGWLENAAAFGADPEPD